MDIDDINSQLVALAYPDVKDVSETFANNTYRSMKESAASVCHTEHEREAVIAAEDVSYECTYEGTSYNLHEKENKDNLAVQLVDEGKPAPVTKGPGGTVTDITGDSIPARSFVEGYTVEEYAWPATHFRDEASQVLQTTEPEIMGDAVRSHAKIDLPPLIKPWITEQISGGVA